MTQTIPTFASPQALLEIVAAQKNGQAAGIYSVCSANRWVLEACMLQAAQDGSVLLIESTSNQVNQSGGYTGLTPAAFARFVGEVAEGMGFPSARVVLGGDHLGPNPWQDENAARAMDKAREMVRAYARAGYSKIHLDASMRCASDDFLRPLDARVSAQRAAELCRAAEAARPAALPPPVYIIGTEVPIPGGAQAPEGQLAVTGAEDARQTIELFREVFAQRGLASAWERVIGLVVQPGVEFGDAELFAYQRAAARPLAQMIEGVPGMLFEAHSTDYQAPQALRQMVEDHFAILKVGPALTFALREAVFALARIEQEQLAGKAGFECSHIVEVLDAAMLSDPRHWVKYYHGDEREQAFARQYSFSDRLRYYWPDPAVQQALARLLANLEQNPPPLPLLSQYLPIQYQHLRAGQIANHPREMIWDHIREVVQGYAGACRAFLA